MEARLRCAALLAAISVSLGSGYRTTNFIISAPTPDLAREIGEAAEKYRRDLALQWLGRELPRWPQPCPIAAEIGAGLGAGGATSFMFERGQPFGWRMTIQGSRERVLDSVLPHEITHTIFATHFGRPLPRWADEGACTTVEHPSEKQKQHQLLHQFLTTGRGIPFNQMFAMTEYPPDVLPLYAQGFSLARFLIAQGGKQKFIQYVGDGMPLGDWTGATTRHYGFRDLSELQVSWLDWVRRGCPQLAPESSGAGQVLLASAGEPQRAAAPARTGQAPDVIYRGQNADPPPSRSGLVPVPPPAGPSPGGVVPHAAPGGTVVALAAGDSWYAQQRSGSRPEPAGAGAIPGAPGAAPNRTQRLEPQRQVLMEWGQPQPAAVPAARDARLPSTHSNGTVWR